MNEFPITDLISIVLFCIMIFASIFRIKQLESENEKLRKKYEGVETEYKNWLKELLTGGVK